MSEKIKTFDKLAEVLGDKMKHQRIINLFVRAVASRKNFKSIYLFSHPDTGYILSWVQPERDKRKRLIAEGYYSPTQERYIIAISQEEPTLDIDMLREAMYIHMGPPYEIIKRKGETNGQDIKSREG